MSAGHAWDSAVWKMTARNVCLHSIGGDATQIRVRGLAYELAEVFAADMAHAVRTFPSHVMRAWQIDQDDLLALIDRRSPISQGTPRWRDVEVELVTICISAIESGLCAACRHQDFGRLDLQMHVRRVCFESIFEFFFFLLRGTAPQADTA